MPVTAIADREIHVDAEGFMTDFDEWDRALAETLAETIGITMTDDHWTVVEFMRKDFAENGVTPTLRRVSTEGTIPTKQLFALFPKKPARKMAYIAGLPKPVGCI